MHTVVAKWQRSVLVEVAWTSLEAAEARRHGAGAGGGGDADVVGGLLMGAGPSLPPEVRGPTARRAERRPGGEVRRRPTPDVRLLAFRFRFACCMRPL